MSTRIAHVLAVLALTLALAACDRTAVVRGEVRDFKGDALPGVAVNVRGQGVQAVTNARGMYSVRCAPGRIVLDLAKTGYTPGRLEAGHMGHGWSDAEPATLWPLPAGHGVFLLENYRYHDTNRAEPKPYVTREHGEIHAVALAVDRVSEGTEPRIVCHRMPPYDLRMHRMQETLAAEPGMDPPQYSRPVWAPERSVPVLVTPIDTLERTLVAVQPTAPPAPGVYAVHWGALEGYTGTDPRVFLFRIPDEDEDGEDEPAEDGEDAENGEAESTADSQ